MVRAGGFPTNALSTNLRPNLPKVRATKSNRLCPIFPGMVTNTFDSSLTFGTTNHPGCLLEVSEVWKKENDDYSTKFQHSTDQSIICSVHHNRICDVEPTILTLTNFIKSHSNKLHIPLTHFYSIKSLMTYDFKPPLSEGHVCAGEADVVGGRGSVWCLDKIAKCKGVCLKLANEA